MGPDTTPCGQAMEQGADNRRLQLRSLALRREKPEVVLLNGVTLFTKAAHVRLCHNWMSRETQAMLFDATIGRSLHAVASAFEE